MQGKALIVERVMQLIDVRKTRCLVPSDLSCLASEVLVLDDVFG